VPTRLTTLDASFLYLEEDTTAMHVGSLMTFQQPEGGFDYERLVELVSARIAGVPRYRQKVRTVPAHLANPVWVDDEDFDVTYHVRRSALPRPGTDQQLLDLVARVQVRPLDRDRPLWEVYLVEGLADGGFAIVTKTHQALVDGINAVDIGQLILDPTETVPGLPVDTWTAEPEPSDLDLVVSALTDVVQRPGDVIDAVVNGIGEVRAVGLRAVGQVGRLASVLAHTAARPAPTSPLNAEIGSARRFVTVATELADYRAIRSRLSRAGENEVTVNDVVLATVAGALRNWLLTRGEPVRPATTVNALVPLSVRDDVGATRLGNSVQAFVVRLPVGEPSPVMRLHQVAYAMRAHQDTGRAIGAEALVGLAGFAPPTLHSLGARVASAMSRRMFNLVVTNVPGPQQPLFAAGARMLASYPVMPLAKGQALSIGLTSYDGSVYYGLNADRDAMADVDVLAQCLVDALVELGTGGR
jgi:diacylglycerol O-acyltransferase / wax synthase